MFEFYVLQQNFSFMLKNHPQLCRQLVTLKTQQCEAMLQKLKPANLYSSAISYFDQPIQWVQDELILYDELQDRQFKIEMKEYKIILNHKENPFLNLLIRKFPNHVLLSLDF